MNDDRTAAPRPRNFSADSPFSLMGILIAGLLGIIIGGLVASLL